ncbi:MAG TPA: hypothetical protein PK563_14485 [Tenuifilaceae bacterium]|nr:hypothetical protein [Tenuifilaceae bacterium]
MLESYIDRIILELPPYLEKLSLQSLENDKVWCKLPKLVKDEFLQRNIRNYTLGDLLLILNMLNKRISDLSMGKKDEIANEIIEVLDYILEGIPCHESELRIAFILKLQEELLMDKISDKNKVILKKVEFYLSEKIKIVHKQKENVFFDERKEEEKSQETYLCLSKSFEENSKKLNHLTSSNNFIFHGLIIKLFIDLYIETPDLSKSNFDSFIPNTLPFLKNRLREIVSINGIRYESLLTFDEQLHSTEKGLKELIDKKRKVLLTLDPRRYYTYNRILMIIHFIEKTLGNLSAFKNYIKKNHINKKRSKPILPEKFMDTITNKELFRKILNEMIATNYVIKESKNKYLWNSRNPELVSFLEKLDEFQLFKYSLKGSYSEYGKLICSHFNQKFLARNFCPSKASSKIDLFSFLNNLKTDK